MEEWAVPPVFGSPPHPFMVSGLWSLVFTKQAYTRVMSNASSLPGGGAQPRPGGWIATGAFGRTRPTPLALVPSRG